MLSDACDPVTGTLKTWGYTRHDLEQAIRAMNVHIAYAATLEQASSGQPALTPFRTWVAQQLILGHFDPAPVEQVDDAHEVPPTLSGRA